MAKAYIKKSPELGKKISNLRERTGMTRSQCAEKLDISTTALYYIEGGQTGLSQKTANAVMRLFDCDEDYLRGESAYQNISAAKEASAAVQYLPPDSALLDVIDNAMFWKKAGEIGHVLAADGTFLRIAVVKSPQRFEDVIDSRNGETFHPDFIVFRDHDKDSYRAVYANEFLKFCDLLGDFIRIEVNAMRSDHFIGFPYYEGASDKTGHLRASDVVNLFKEGGLQ